MRVSEALVKLVISSRLPSPLPPARSSLPLIGSDIFRTRAIELRTTSFQYAYHMPFFPHYVATGICLCYTQGPNAPKPDDVRAYMHLQDCDQSLRGVDHGEEGVLTLCVMRVCAGQLIKQIMI